MTLKKIAAALLAMIMLTPAFSGEILTPEKLLVLIRENSADWEKGTLTLSRQLLESDLKETAYNSDWYLTPSYTFYAPVTRDGSDFPLGNIYSLSLGFSRLLPTNGTITVELEDGFGLILLGGDRAFSQDLSAEITYTQPFLSGGRLIDKNAYADTRRVAVDIPRAMASVQNRLRRSDAVAGILSEYYSLLLSEEDYRLQEKKQELRRRELVQLSSLKERGMYSGADYWKKQLEAEQGDDALLEKRHALLTSRRKLAVKIGIEEDFALPRLLLSERELPPSPTDIWTNWPETNGEWQLAGLNDERARLTAESGVNGRSSDLVMGFSLAPDYIEGSPSDRDLAGSYSDLFLPESPLTAEFTMAMTYSPGRIRKNRLTAEQDSMNSRIAGLEKEEKMTELLSRRVELENRDEMLLLKLERIEESIEYLKVLLNKEKKLLELSSSTPLAVEEAGLNLDLRILDRQTALVDLYRNRLDLMALSGADIVEPGNLLTPGENE